jgi:hypothetical protein
MFDSPLQSLLRAARRIPAPSDRPRHVPLVRRPRRHRQLAAIVVLWPLVIALPIAFPSFRFAASMLVRASEPPTAERDNSCTRAGGVTCNDRSRCFPTSPSRRTPIGRAQRYPRDGDS